MREIVTLHKLKPEGFPELKAVHDGFCPDPKSSIALVARDSHGIVGRVFLVAPVHVEGPWVEESRRGGWIGKRLMDAAEVEAKQAGITKLFAYGASAELEGYLERLGYKREPLTVYMKEL